MLLNLQSKHITKGAIPETKPKHIIKGAIRESGKKQD